MCNLLSNENNYDVIIFHTYWTLKYQWKQKLFYEAIKIKYSCTCLMLLMSEMFQTKKNTSLRIGIQ